MQVGTIVRNRYRVERELPATVSSRIFLAIDMGTEAKIAIKKFEQFTHAGLRFFTNEHAALTHLARLPGVVPLLDADEDSQLLVLGWAGDRDLAALILDDSQNNWGVLGPHLVRLCRTLEIVHSRKVIYRDLTPANILIDGHRSTLIDFGISWVHTGPDAFKGELAGTPRYMSPEQVRMSSTLDHRTDLYSVGALLYLVAFGVPLFHTIKGSDNLMNAQLNTTPDFSMQLRCGVPAGLRNILVRNLEKDPSARFPTASDLAIALQNL